MTNIILSIYLIIFLTNILLSYEILSYKQRHRTLAPRGPIMNFWWTRQWTFPAWSLGSRRWRSSGIGTIASLMMTVGAMPALQVLLIVHVVQGSPHLPNSLWRLQLAEWRNGDGGQMGWAGSVHLLHDRFETKSRDVSHPRSGNICEQFVLSEGEALRKQISKTFALPHFEYTPPLTTL